MKPFCEVITTRVLPAVRSIMTRDLLTTYGLTQKQTADLLGFTQPAISQYNREARGSKVRFLREWTITWIGEVSSLRRFNDDVKEVQAGLECGIGLSDFQDLKAGDVIETYEEIKIART